MQNVIVLNQDYMYLNTVPFRKAVRYLEKGKALVEKYSGTFVLTESTQYGVPLIVRMVDFVQSIYKRGVSWSKKNVMIRDGHKCVYCGATSNLNIDHVFPKSKGGKNTFKNTVTSCMTCNNTKGDRTPDEAGMSFRIKGFAPKTPTVADFLIARFRQTDAYSVLKEYGMC